MTDRLYGGDQEHRIKQEMLAGIGGVRAIRAFTAVEGLPEPQVFHMNEGHAGFLGVERIRELVTDGGLDFDTALTVVRSSTVFTTHTPGARRHRPLPGGDGRAVLRRRASDDVGAIASWLPGVPLDRIVAFGAEDDPSKFNMAHMGLRLAQRANGVSLLHGEVSRGMFNELWPGFDQDEVPIGSITNGVHAPTWAAPQWVELARELIGSEDLGSLSEADDLGAAAAGRSRPPVVDPVAAARAARSTTCAAGCGGPGWSAARRRPNWAGSQRLSTRTC